MNVLPNVARVRPGAARALVAARGAWARVVAGFESPWGAYPLLLALQLKVVWGLWAVRDITSGDTSSYFASAWRWYAEGRLNVAWSPLYCAFYGTFLHLNPDPVWATAAHRVAIVLLSGALALGVFRQLLPPAVAWLCAAWWAVLPIAFNTLYEVHLFAVLPVLAVWLLMATARGPARRAAGLAVLGASVVLVRNELSVPFAVLALVAPVWEWRAARAADGSRGRALARAAGWYAAALAAAAGVCAAAYERSTIKYPELREHLRIKHTLNMAQVYAYGYQQRHPEWTRSPWIECQPLMEETFGQPLPSLREMIAANPRATWEHFAWNMRLAPNGVQILLFNGTQGGGNPDYIADAQMPLGREYPRYLTAALGVVWAVGMVVLWRRRAEWRPELGSARALAWLSMLVVVSVVPLVITTQRARPSYLFAFAVVLMAATGALFWLAVRSCGLGERLRAALPLIAAGLLAAVPGYYTGLARSEARPPERVGAAALGRLQPYRAEIARPGVSLVAARGEVRRYLHPLGPDVPDALYAVLVDWKRGEALTAPLERAGVGYLYLDEEARHIFSGTGRSRDELAFLGSLAPGGWEKVAGGDEPGRWWRLYRRAPGAPAPAPPTALAALTEDLEHPAARVAGVTPDGWFTAASAVLTQPAAARELVFRGEVLNLPGEADFRTELVLTIDGREVGRRVLAGGPFEVRFPAPAPAPAGPRALAWTCSNPRRLPTPDTRTAAARLLFLGFAPGP